MLIFRNDDIGANSNFNDIQKVYTHIKFQFPTSEIYSCIYLLEKEGHTPVDVKCDYNTNKIFDFTQLPILHTVVSHGLMHISHKQVSVEIQELSILISCNLLNTKIFLPPFVQWNKDTERICSNNGIKLLGTEKWRSLDKEEFDSSYPLWLFHSWRHIPEKLIEKLKAGKNANKSN